MRAKSRKLMHVLLEHFHGENKEEWLSYLTNEEEKDVANQEGVSCSSSFLKNLAPLSQNEIQQVHYSWFAPEFKEFPEALRLYFISVLPPYYKKGVSALLQVEEPKETPSPFIKRFFLQKLQKQLREKQFLQQEVEPSTKLSFLEEFTKPQLVELIDFFALHDLAEDIRHIVDKEKLRKIYQLLDKKRRLYLRQCLHNKSPNLSKKIGLDHWNGNGKLLLHVLHRRGLKKFASVLSTEKKTVLERFCYRLDIGRGNFLKAELLQKTYKQKESEELTALLLKLVHFLKGIK